MPKLHLATFNWLAIVLWYGFSIFCFTSFDDRTYLQDQETDRYLTKPMLKTNTVEPPLSDHLKCDDLVVANENQPREEVPIYLLFGREFIACNFLVTICVLPCCDGKFFYTLSGVGHAANNASSCLLQEIKNNGKL